MNRIKLITMILFLFGCRFLCAQTGVIPVYACVNPGVKAVTSGVSSSNFLQGVIPTCLVTVYLTGTTNKATIYKDSSNTPQNNPFSANTNGSIPPIYAATSATYDVQLSGGIPPNTYTSPVTLTGVGTGAGGGAGVLISFQGRTTPAATLQFADLTSTISTQNPHVICFVGPVSGSAAATTCRTMSLDEFTPGFTITSFSGGSTVEIGATVTNPAFTASYSSLPTSAQITNTDSIDSPLVLTTPFTSGTVVGAFRKTAATSTTFTLTAIGTATQTANQSINWQPRTFGGVGAAGATSTVTASGNNAVLSTSDTINNAGLNNQSQYGPYTPNNQKIYILMIGGSHTFIDANTGFAIPFNTPTAVAFINQNGVSVAMFLYETTALIGNGVIQFLPRVTS